MVPDIATRCCSQNEALANELLERATQAVDLFKHDSLSLEDLVAVDQEHSGRIQKARRFLRLHLVCVGWCRVGRLLCCRDGQVSAKSTLSLDPIVHSTSSSLEADVPVRGDVPDR